VSTRNYECHTAYNRSNHRTGDRIPDHSGRAAVGIGQRDEADRQHEDKTAYWAAEVPSAWPDRDPHQKADEKAIQIVGPDQDGAVKAIEVKLLRNRAVQIQ
jgi:hypothetical protein